MARHANRRAVIRKTAIQRVPYIIAFEKHEGYLRRVLTRLARLDVTARVSVAR
jgi:hypothetical protein